MRCYLEARSAEIILRCAIAVIIGCRSRSPLGHLWRRIKRVIAFILFKALWSTFIFLSGSSFHILVQEHVDGAPAGLGDILLPFAHLWIDTELVWLVLGVFFRSLRLSDIPSDGSWDYLRILLVWLFKMTWSEVISLQLIVVKRVFFKLSLFLGLLLKYPGELRISSDESLHAWAIILLLSWYSIPESLVLVIELDWATVLNFFTFEGVVNLVFRYIVVLLHSDFIEFTNNQLWFFV